MRDIKYRAWDTVIKYFVDSGIWFDNTTMQIKTIPGFILEQYTGLKDKNGVKIFEGDIIKIAMVVDEHQIAQVVFQDGCFGVKPWFDYAWSLVPLWLPTYNRKKERDIEIIGNVHSNPDLLEAKE